jgi:hypothetical protein
MERFWDLFSRSMILSGFIVVLCMGSLCYLAVTGQVIPQILVDINLIVVSFFFGTRASNNEAAARASRRGE